MYRYKKLGVVIATSRKDMERLIVTLEDQGYQVAYENDGSLMFSILEDYDESEELNIISE